MQAIASPARRHPRRWLAVMGVLAVAGGSLTVALGHASRARAATSVGCGQALTASVTLAADLTCADTDALVVAKAGITINLGGHTISVIRGNGIVDDNGFGNVIVTNGTITRANTGISSNGALKISKLRLAHNQTAIELRTGGSTVSGSQIWENSVAGILVYGSDGSSTALTTITGNHVVGTGGTGISVSRGPATISGNTVLNNSGPGIRVGPDASGALVSKNVSNGNSGGGIAVIPEVATINSNTARFNTGYGISASGGDIDDAKNRASDNGTSGQCLFILCS